MRRILTILLLSITFAGKAQYVAIPDNNLQTILEEIFPECFQNGLLDTLCAGSLTNSGIGIEGLDIQSLEGMQYFKNFTSFYCGNNLLTDLKFLPPNITFLNAPDNLIQRIDSLPKNLTFLDLSDNSLSALPELPIFLAQLNLRNNPSLSCLPLLPPGMQTLTISQTAIRCLPNKPPGLNAGLTPLCNPVNNPSNCQALPVISGRVFVDLNNNGIKDSGEPFRKGMKIQIASTNLYTFSDDAGYYELSVPASGSYSISVSSSYYSATPATVMTSTTTPASHDIALQIVQAANDFKISVVNYNFARPGFGMAFLIEVDNVGSIAEPAEVRFAIPNLFTVDSASITGTLQAGVMSWQFANIQPGERHVIVLYGTLNASAVLGDLLSIIVRVNPEDTEDYDPTNNVATLHLIIQGAYDPNDKQGPDTIRPAQIASGDFIYYTIRFQNTGTDTAFTVIISDLLDTKLQVATLELLSSSHNCRTDVQEQQVFFIFEDILLPDSTTNLVGSCGYVQFRIRPQTTLAEGESIPNKAGIYFDYNEPIITNTVQSLIRDPETTTQLLSSSKAVLMQVFPNPADEGLLYISTGTTYKIHNHHGISVATGLSDGSAISVQHLPAGLYLVEMSMGNVYKTEKILVKK
jgi:uncharacterized repeat protein (TIGR01451 family)